MAKEDTRELAEDLFLELCPDYFGSLSRQIRERMLSYTVKFIGTDEVNSLMEQTQKYKENGAPPPTGDAPERPETKGSGTIRQKRRWAEYIHERTGIGFPAKAHFSLELYERIADNLSV